MDQEGGTGSSGFVDGKHPLLIDLIADNVLSNLNLKDLLNVRLVCKDWNRLSFSKVKEKAKEISFTTIDLRVPRRCGSTWSYFLQTMATAEAIPVTKLRLVLQSGTPELSEFDGLLDLCHESLTSLSIANHSSFTGSGVTEDHGSLRDWLAKENFLKLESLTLRNFEFGESPPTSTDGSEFKSVENLRQFHLLDVSRDCKPSQQFYDAFFRKTQKLAILSLGVLNYREEYESHFPKPEAEYAIDSSDEERQLEQYDNDHDEMLQIIDFHQVTANRHMSIVVTSLCNTANLTNIKCIKLFNYSNMASIVRLGQAGLRLDQFELLELGEQADLSKQELNEFLQFQNTSLKSLTISVNWEEADLELCFPDEMKHLIDLSIHSGGAVIIQKSINYFEQFPKIRKMRFSSGGRRSGSREQCRRLMKKLLSEEHNPVPCLTMKTVRIFLSVTASPHNNVQDKVQRMERIFPQLSGSHLKVDLDVGSGNSSDDDDDDDNRHRPRELSIFASLP